MARVTNPEPTSQPSALIGPRALMRHNESPATPPCVLFDDPTYGYICDNIKGDPSLDALFQEVLNKECPLEEENLDFTEFQLNPFLALKE